MNTVLVGHTFASGQRLLLVEGDLTQETVDAIVNAANDQLIHGGGVAGAISRRGGPEIQAQSDAWVQEHGPVSHREPAYTSGGKLPARYVIHAVGPVWGTGNEDAKLGAAVYGSLEIAERLELTSIAFPAISTGIFGFPKRRAAHVILETCERYFAEHPGSGLVQVRMTLFDKPTLGAFLETWEALGWGDLASA